MVDVDFGTRNWFIAYNVQSCFRYVAVEEFPHGSGLMCIVGLGPPLQEMDRVEFSVKRQCK